MKKIILLAISLFIILTPQLVRAENDFIINNFKSDITIQDNGQIMVEETVKVFFYQPKHGIYRDIPYVYQSPDGKKTYTEIIVDNVTDGIKNIPYEVTSNESNIRIRIGNPNKTVSGSQEYLIRYYASGVLRSFDDNEISRWINIIFVHRYNDIISHYAKKVNTHNSILRKTYIRRLYHIIE